MKQSKGDVIQNEFNSLYGSHSYITRVCKICCLTNLHGSEHKLGHQCGYTDYIIRCALLARQSSKWESIRRNLNLGHSDEYDDEAFLKWLAAIDGSGVTHCMSVVIQLLSLRKE